MRPSWRWAAGCAAALIALGVGGCALSLGSRPRSSGSPAITSTAAGPRTPAAPAGTGSVPTAAATPRGARGPRVAGGWSTPAGAVRGFAATYINWTAADVAGRLRALAAVSVGQAHASLLTQAREVADDADLRRGGVSNAGTVEAVAPVPRSRDRFVVVTRERTSATDDSAYAGLAAAWHVALATVTRVPGRLWVLSDWAPEN